MPVSPDVAAYLETQKRLPLRDSLSVAQTREFMRSRSALAGPPPVVGSVEDRRIADVPCRIYRLTADDDMPVVVFFHGGRFFSGDLDTHDTLCREITAQTGCMVVSVDYRLAPEHKFPAAVDDAVAVTRVVVAGHKRVAVCGDSAGGNLAAVAAREVPGLAMQMLLYPMLDATCSRFSYALYAIGFGPGAQDMKRGWREYMPEGVDPKDPRLSPLFAEDLTGLPGGFVVTAEFDPLRDEGEAYAERLTRAGMRVSRDRVGGMIHGFLQLGAAIPHAHKALAVRTFFLRDALGLALPLPLSDALDMYPVAPIHAEAVLAEYLAASRQRGYGTVRIFTGVMLPEDIHAVLERTPFVESFFDEPLEPGGRRAIIVRLSASETRRP